MEFVLRRAIEIEKILQTYSNQAISETRWICSWFGEINILLCRSIYTRQSGTLCELRVRTRASSSSSARYALLFSSFRLVLTGHF